MFIYLKIMYFFFIYILLCYDFLLICIYVCNIYYIIFHIFKYYIYVQIQHQIMHCVFNLIYFLKLYKKNYIRRYIKFQHVNDLSKIRNAHWKIILDRIFNMELCRSSPIVSLIFSYLHICPAGIQFRTEKRTLIYTEIFLSCYDKILYIYIHTLSLLFSNLRGRKCVQIISPKISVKLKY